MSGLDQRRPLLHRRPHPSRQPVGLHVGCHGAVVHPRGLGSSCPAAVIYQGLQAPPADGRRRGSGRPFQPLILLTFAGAALVGFTVAGVAGIGGGIITLPALIEAVGARDAISALVFTQILAALGRMYFSWQDISWPVVHWFCFVGDPRCGRRQFRTHRYPLRYSVPVAGWHHIADGGGVPTHPAGRSAGA